MQGKRYKWGNLNMNIIVTNQYKDLIEGTNIEIMKELNGVFKVSEIANSFNSIFYKN